MTTTPAPDPGPAQPLLSSDGRLRVVPILHGRFEFAVEVRRAFAEHQPTHVALELPSACHDAILAAVRRLPLPSVLRVTRAGSGGNPVFLVVEPTDALIEAARLAVENGLPVHLADRDSTRVAPIRQSFPDPHALESLGLERYAALCRELAAQDTGDPEDELRERTMAHRLTALLADPEARVLFVCGLTHAERVLERAGSETASPFGRPPRLDVELFHLHPDASREVLSEIPYLAGAYERWRAAQADAGHAANEPWPLPRHSVHRELIREARHVLRREEGDEVSPASVANLLRFARNCSLMEGALSPDFYTLVLAARGVADDNFAYHVWDVGSTYPHAESADARPSLRVSLEDLDRSGRLIQFRRKIRRRRRVPQLLRSRRRERRAGEWRKQWTGFSICSHPPEDIVIEGYGRFLSEKAKGILAADRSRVEPFTTSLLDGIDFRETIRNRAHDGRVYVRCNLPVKGNVGSVVVAFDAEDREDRFPFRMTWQGEHDQESDMALYSTGPGEQLAGPGISRCEYGGFLLTWPPGRMFSVWDDPEFQNAISPGEHLLLAGIDYAPERMVVYVAPSPPRSLVRAYASRRDRQVVYVPIGQLSPVTLKRIRTFHVLDGQHVRDYAREYIW
jgi:hypothetical protein